MECIRSNKAQKLVSRGFNLIAISALLTKFGSALTQLVLGWFLVPEEFALFAAAVSAQLIIAGLRDAGVSRFLVQRGIYSGLAYKTAIFVLLINAAALLILFASIPFFQEIYAQPDLHKVIVPIALCIPIQSIATIFKSKLRIEMQFGKIARLEVISSFLQYSSTITGAFLGMGVYSLVLGTVMASSGQFLLGKIYAGGLGERREPFSRSDFQALWKGCKWIILSSFLLAIGARGDYFVLGLLEDKALVGYYFFGFQMAFAVEVLFSSSLQMVFLPSLSRIVRNGEDDRKALRDGQSELGIKAGVISFFAALVAPEMIHVLWQGKWDHSSWIFISVMLTTPFFMTAALAGVYLEAHGLWKSRAWSMCQQAIVTIGAAALALLYPKMWALVTSVVLGRILVTIWQLFYIRKRLKKPVFSSISGSLVWQLKIACAAATAWCVSLLAENAYLVLLLKAGCFGVIFVCAYFYFRRRRPRTA